MAEEIIIAALQFDSEIFKIIVEARFVVDQKWHFKNG